MAGFGPFTYGQIKQVQARFLCGRSFLIDMSTVSRLRWYKPSSSSSECREALLVRKIYSEIFFICLGNISVFRLF